MFCLCRHLFFSDTNSQKNSKLSGYVVTAGLQYGQGENLFHYYFKVDYTFNSQWDKVCERSL